MVQYSSHELSLSLSLSPTSSLSVYFFLHPIPLGLTTGTNPSSKRPLVNRGVFTVYCEKCVQCPVHWKLKSDLDMWSVVNCIRLKSAVDRPTWPHLAQWFLLINGIFLRDRNQIQTSCHVLRQANVTAVLLPTNGHLQTKSTLQSTLVQPRKINHLFFSFLASVSQWGVTPTASGLFDWTWSTCHL